MFKTVIQGTCVNMPTTCWNFNFCVAPDRHDFLFRFHMSLPSHQQRHATCYLQQISSCRISHPISPRRRQVTPAALASLGKPSLPLWPARHVHTSSKSGEHVCVALDLKLLYQCIFERFDKSSKLIQSGI